MRVFGYLLFIGTVLLLTGACKENQYYLFNDVGRLQFGPTPNLIYQSGSNLADTLKRYTFVYESEETTQDTVFFDLYAVGGPSDRDRPFRLVQEEVRAANNAVANVHYKSFDHPDLYDDYVIKAGKVHARIPVVLFRHPSLKETPVVLKLTIEANEYFEKGDVLNLWRKVEFSDELTQPVRWDAWFIQYAAGVYSKRKHQFMIEVTGQRWDAEFLDLIISNTSIRTYWIAVVKNAWMDYNNVHPGNPMREDQEDPNSPLILFP